MSRTSSHATPHSGNGKSGFRWAPTEIAVSRDRNLKPIDKAVYGVLNSHADIRTRTTTLAVATIADETPCSVRTAQISIAALIERGLLEREERFAERRQITSLYRLVGGDAPCYQKSEQRRNAFESQEGAGSAGDAENVEICVPVGAENDAPGGAESAHKREPVSNENQKNNPSPLTPQGENGEGDGTPEPEKPKHDTAGEGQGQEPEPEQKQAPSSGLCAAILDAYHRILPELKLVPKLTTAHVREIEARIREDPARAELAWWERYFRSIRDCPCAMGKAGSNWKASFEWLIGKRGMEKVLGGAFIPASAAKGGCEVGEGGEDGWELQKRYTDEEGVVDARSLLRAI